MQVAAGMVRCKMMISAGMVGHMTARCRMISAKMISARIIRCMMVRGSIICAGMI
jgi:hypothetical protein